MIVDGNKYPMITEMDLRNADISLIVFNETELCYYAVHGNTLTNLNSSYEIDFYNPQSYANLRKFLFEHADATYTMNLAIRKQPMSYRQTRFEVTAGDVEPDFIILGIPYTRVSEEDNDSWLDTRYVNQWAIVASSFYGENLFQLYRDVCMQKQQTVVPLDNNQKPLASSWFHRLLGK